MAVRRSRSWLGLMLATFLLVQPGWVGAQCTTAITNSGTAVSPMGMAYTFITKTLMGTYQCTLTMAMNAFYCNPGPTIGATGSVSYLAASAFAASTNPSCAWNCGCGAVTIDANDGLPVELLGFEIED